MAKGVGNGSTSRRRTRSGEPKAAETTQAERARTREAPAPAGDPPPRKGGRAAKAPAAPPEATPEAPVTPSGRKGKPQAAKTKRVEKEQKAAAPKGKAKRSVAGKARTKAKPAPEASEPAALPTGSPPRTGPQEAGAGVEPRDTDEPAARDTGRVEAVSRAGPETVEANEPLAAEGSEPEGADPFEREGAGDEDTPVGGEREPGEAGAADAYEAANEDEWLGLEAVANADESPTDDLLGLEGDGAGEEPSRVISEGEILPPEEDATLEGDEIPRADELPEVVEAARPSATRAAVNALVLARDLVGHTLQSGRFSKLWDTTRGLARAVATSLGAGGSREVDEYGMDPELTRALSPVASFFYERYWRVSVQGAEHLPSGASLVVVNHSGALPFDGPILGMALSRERPDLSEARWLVEDQIFHAPFLGTLINRLGAVRASPENALRLLSESRPVIVFPEGAQGTGKPFRERYQLKRLGRGGFAKLAVRAGVPIVPAAVVGAEEALPLLGKLPGRALGLPDLPITPGPLPAKWSIRFGEPIDTRHLGPAAAEDLKEVQRLVEQTRGEIEGMLQALLKERRSVFAG